MRIPYTIVVLCTLLCTCCLITDIKAVDVMSDQQVEVAIRTIGHEVMMAHGDSTSRVLPIQKDEQEYTIQFATTFQFQSGKLILAVDDAVKRTALASHYLVQMQDGDTDEIIYSYEVDGVLDMSKIACGERVQPEASYTLIFTILDDARTMVAEMSADEQIALVRAGYPNALYVIIPMILLMGIAVYFKRNNSISPADPNIIAIGSYRFDKRNMTLSLADNSIELTSKEADLLELLQSSANTTIERDDILRHVWGDKGDYVGRTLDVFISKLRKKLEGDPAVKIANIRGVGYRLVVN